VEAYLKRYFWALKLSLMSAVAFSASGVANHALLSEASKAINALSPNDSQKIKTKPVEIEQRKAWGAQISERNLFNAHPPSPEEEAQRASDEPKEPEEPKSALPEPYDECEESKQGATLKLTMVAEPASSSYAIVELGGDDRIVREGDAFEELQVVAIQWNGEGGRVVVQEEGKYTCLVLGKKSPRAKRKGVKRSKPRKRRSSAKDDKFKDGIKEVSPGRFEVDRAMLDEQLADLDNIVRQARVIPHYRQGKPVGFKVVGIRSNSIFRHLGLKSGDVLKSVGGEELTSINKALGLFEKLKSSNNVNIDIERLGKGQSLEYNIK
jgi:general secretion pathway protein C